MRTTIALMAAAALAAAGGVAGCQRAKPQVAALPLQMGAAAPLGEAPPAGGLPPAPPAQIGTLADHRDAYAYPDRAWGMSWGFGDSPPDYAFDDDGVTPWVWVADDDSECLAEPVPGGERYYYFEPGAYTPFYVQDPSYGYAFENGLLVALYARGGREMAPAADPAAAATAGQYLARGRLLRQAAASQPHQAVAAANWNARRGLIAAEHASFARNAARQPAWLSYHNQHLAQDQARYAAEATRRESWAAQTDSNLGLPLRAQREQRLAQSIGEGARPRGGARIGPAPGASPQVAAPTQVLNRYAAAAPRRATPFVRSESPRAAGRQAQAELGGAFEPTAVRTGRTAFAAAPMARARPEAPAERPLARAAGEHGSDAAAEARDSAAIATRRVAESPQAAAPARAFHAPTSAPALAPRAAPQAAPQVHPGPRGGDGDNKRH